MTDKQKPPWHERSTFLGRWVLRLVLMGVAWVMSGAYWQLILQFWNGVPFRTVTRTMSMNDWNNDFGASDVIGYVLSIFCFFPFWFFAVGCALIALQKQIAHDMITGMKRRLTLRKNNDTPEDQGG